MFIAIYHFHTYRQHQEQVRFASVVLRCLSVNRHLNIRLELLRCQKKIVPAGHFNSHTLFRCPPLKPPFMSVTLSHATTVAEFFSRPPHLCRRVLSFSPLRPRRGSRLRRLCHREETESGHPASRLPHSSVQAILLTFYLATANMARSSY